MRLDRRTILAGLAALAAPHAAAQAPAVQADPVVVTGTRVEQKSFELPMSIVAVEATGPPWTFVWTTSQGRPARLFKALGQSMKE